jgi:4-amino-4-deoxy-L-arabinose transferase-like glycosyltransferase
MKKFFFSRGLILLLAAAIVVLPRVFWQNPFFIQDEIRWIERAHVFVRAVGSGDTAATHSLELGFHPAIPLKYAAGIAVDFFARKRGLTETFYAWQENDQLAATLWAKKAAGLLSAMLLLAFTATLLKTRFGQKYPWQTLFVVTMVSLEPWPWAISRVVHTDAILGYALLLALTCAWVAREKRSLSWSFIAGLTWGFAFLSKVTALILAPLFFFVILLPSPWRWRRGCWSASLARLLLSVEGIIISFFVWPAFWTRPAGTIYDIIARIFFHTGKPEIYLWPGIHPPLFLYLLSLSALGGLVAYLALRLFSVFREGKLTALKFQFFDFIAVSGLFLGGVLVYLAADHARWNVPVLVLLATAGAAGWLALGKYLREKVGFLLLGILIIAVHLLDVLPWFPYLDNYYNPLWRSLEAGKYQLVDDGGSMLPVVRTLNNLFYEDKNIFVASTISPYMLIPFLEPPLKDKIIRFPSSGLLGELPDETTHLLVSASLPARVLFDVQAQRLLPELRRLKKVTTIYVRDVPLAHVYRLR